LRDTRGGAFAGIVGGVIAAAAASLDYIMGGALGEQGGVGFALVHVVGYVGMLVAVVGVGQRYRVALGRLGRVALYGLVSAFAVLATVFALIALVGQPAAVQAVAGVAFLAMLILGPALGVVLWRRTRSNRRAAILLMLALPMMIVTGVVGAFGWFAVHPALGEVPLYLGVATLGYQRLSSPDVGPRASAAVRAEGSRQA
jgi:hypothetical protein